MAWIGHLRQGRAVDEKGQPVAGAQVLLLDGAGRPQETLAPTNEKGEFHIQRLTAIEPDLQVFLAHPEHVRCIGPVATDDSTLVSYEMRRKTKISKAQISAAPNARVAFLERDSRGLVAVFELRTDGTGLVTIPADPACNYRNVPFVQSGGALLRLKPNLAPSAMPSLDDLATDMRFRDQSLLRRTAKETTYHVPPDIHLRFFFIPSSFEDAIAFAPLLDAYDQTRDAAFRGLHPNFCPLVRAGVTEGIGYTAYQVPGDSLEQIVKSRGPLSDGESMQVYQDVEAVLPALEAAGLAHGNIAPRYVYRGPEGWRVAPPCPALPAGVHFPRSHQLTDGRFGDDAFGVGTVLHFAATGREPQFDVETVSPPPDVDGIIEHREKLRLPGKPFDDLLKSMLQRR